VQRCHALSRNRRHPGTIAVASARRQARRSRRLTARDYADNIGWHLTMLRKSKPKYVSVSKQTGVPWYFIGVIHAPEASFNFRAHLHNGDHPLSQRTRQVPSGRPLAWAPPGHAGRPGIEREGRAAPARLYRQDRLEPGADPVPAGGM